MAPEPTAAIIDAQSLRRQVAIGSCSGSAAT
jgi:hypothetical protein